MARLIDANVFKKNMEQKYGFYARQPQEDIDAQPTIDAVPVVRCKDCKYAHMTTRGEVKYCDTWFPEDAVYADGDYYCASGERKDGENDGEQDG